MCTETSRLDSTASDSILPTWKVSALLPRPEGTIHHNQEQQQQELLLTDTADQETEMNYVLNPKPTQLIWLNEGSD
jgi:hypothetical protein